MTKKLKDKIRIAGKEYGAADVDVIEMPDGRVKVKTKGDATKMLEKLQRHTGTKWKKKDCDDAIAACEQIVGRDMQGLQPIRPPNEP